MTQELLDKFKAYAEAREKELRESPNAKAIAIKHLQEIGYLDENGSVSEAYRGGIPDYTPENIELPA